MEKVKKLIERKNNHSNYSLWERAFDFFPVGL